ncbi:MAG TPA: VWA domain-containing protein [Gemmatimonadales bacterium]|nr:VWA domain-containing protein [Gemmatimonadales bacterium]
MVDGEAMTANVMQFGRLLRRAGMEVDPGQTATFLRALTLLGFDDRSDVRIAGRTIFVRRWEDLAIYDAAFELFWRRRGEGSSGPQSRLPRIRQGEDRGPAGGTMELDLPTTDEQVAAVRARAASAREVLRKADFASLTPAESRDANAMLEALRPRLPMRRARRSRPERSGHRPATRSMLRQALASGGEALRWRWLGRTECPRPMVLVCDISGSMEPYSRFMLRFGHALRRSGARVEVFVFATRLTRITRQLAVRSPDTALQRVADKVVDWSGGTRIGESLRELNRRWVRRTVRSGAIVLLVSDGWERGDPAVLAREMAVLQRSCHRLIWLDPLASRPGFEPATEGLRAALPFMDDFVPCASVASLEQMAQHLGRL